MILSIANNCYWTGFFSGMRLENTGVELSGERNKILQRRKSIVYRRIIGRSEKLTEIDRPR